MTAKVTKTHMVNMKIPAPIINLLLWMKTKEVTTTKLISIKMDMIKGLSDVFDRKEIAMRLLAIGVINRNIYKVLARRDSSGSSN
jgi:hypothetical protein